MVSIGRVGSMERYRINAFVARAMGISRRKADVLLKKRTRDFCINGRLFDGNLGLKVTGDDVVEFQGRRLRLPSPVYVILNKPRGYVSSMSDPHADRLVIDLLPQRLRRLKPVGRLDKETRGLLLFTDNSRIIHQLLHPKKAVEKEYLVTVHGRLTPLELDPVVNGMDMDDYRSLPAWARIERVSIEESVVRLIMIEGKKHQIRDMFAKIGHPVKDLVRIGFGPLRLGRLKEGSWRYLTDAEIKRLSRIAPVMR